MEIDKSKGEWRCRCPEDDEFDTSANPKWVSKCTTCGALRPNNELAQLEVLNGCDEG
jgi:hypothetical protein